MQCWNCQQENPPEARFCAHCGAAFLAAAESAPQPAPRSSTVPIAAEEYVGFRARFGAAVLDCVAIYVLSFFITVLHTPGLFPVSRFLLPWLYFWLFTGLLGQTPGKMLLGIKVINYQGDRPGLKRAALREILGKIVSASALGLGFLWIVWDRHKQGWHDKVAGTYVVKSSRQK